MRVTNAADPMLDFKSFEEILHFLSTENGRPVCKNNFWNTLTLKMHSQDLNYLICSPVLCTLHTKHPTLSKHRPSGPMLSLSQNVRLCVRLSVCPFTFGVPFNGLFAPTSRSQMSNIFRDSESFGKRNGKKWSNI